MNGPYLKLQGENQHLPDFVTHFKYFRQNILFQPQLNKKCFTYFNVCQSFSQQTETPFSVGFAIEAMGALKILSLSGFEAINY